VIGSFRAEWLKMRKRPAVWVLFSVLLVALVLLGRLEESLHLSAAESLHLAARYPRSRCSIRRVPGDHSPSHGLAQGAVKHGVCVVDRSRREPAPVEGGVCALDVSRGQIAQTDRTNQRKQPLHVQAIGVIGLGPDAWARRVLKPLLQVLTGGLVARDDRHTVVTGPHELAHLLEGVALGARVDSAAASVG